jgi:hypothetical protein
LGLLYAATLFVSALLLFLVQPMAGKMLLPKLGGTPAVWNTCMVFFQAMLLAGYGYAHLLSTRFPVRRQVLIHLGVLALPLFVLPIGLAEGAVPSPDANPIPWLLWTLLVAVGLPFFVLATSAPLLQKWFTATGHGGGRDPYYLYAASNLGSMLALIGYPTLVEPYLPLKAVHFLSQSWLWAVGYGVLLTLTACCARIVWRAGENAPDAEPGLESESVEPPPSLKEQLRWVALAFVPSSFMLGVTTAMTLDIAALPLLWVIPLALYLLSFILVFARWPSFMHTLMILIMPLFTLMLVYVKAGGLKPAIGPEILLNLITFFLAALVCHGELARRRPPPRYLTNFYLFMSLGGVLGGAFNALIAPLVFKGVAEYPIAIVLACLLLPSLTPGKPTWISKLFERRWAGVVGIVGDVAFAAILGLFAYGTIYFWKVRVPTQAASYFLKSVAALQHFAEGQVTAFVDSDFATHRHIPEPYIRSLLMYGVPALICYCFVSRSLRFGLGVASVLGASFLWDSQHDYRMLHQERSFFGVLKVQSWGDSHYLYHGTTLHGRQIFDTDHQHEPQTYYHPSGPIGQVFAALDDKLHDQDIAIIGLGTGTLTCYGQADQRLTIYDIDPAIVRIATNPEYFTYLTDCKAKSRIILGDARLRLAEAKDASYGMIAVDAFSSDAIPIHLITREAMELYFQKLNDHGVLAVHISNRYLDLEPVLANLAENMGLIALDGSDHDESEKDPYPGKEFSEWVMLARRPEDFGSLMKDSRWPAARTSAKVGVWTDDYSNLLSVFSWK